MELIRYLPKSKHKCEESDVFQFNWPTEKESELDSVLDPKTWEIDHVLKFDFEEQVIKSKKQKIKCELIVKHGPRFRVFGGPTPKSYTKHVKGKECDEPEECSVCFQKYMNQFWEKVRAIAKHYDGPIENIPSLFSWDLFTNPTLLKCSPLRFNMFIINPKCDHINTFDREDYVYLQKFINDSEYRSQIENVPILEGLSTFILKFDVNKHQEFIDKKEFNTLFSHDIIMWIAESWQQIFKEEKESATKVSKNYAYNRPKTNGKWKLECGYFSTFEIGEIQINTTLNEISFEYTFG